MLSPLWKWNSTTIIYSTFVQNQTELKFDGVNTISLISCVITEIHNNLAYQICPDLEPKILILMALTVIENKYSNSAYSPMWISFGCGENHIVCFDITLSPHDYFRGQEREGKIRKDKKTVSIVKVSFAIPLLTCFHPTLKQNIFTSIMLARDFLVTQQIEHHFKK